MRNIFKSKSIVIDDYGVIGLCLSYKLHSNSSFKEGTISHNFPIDIELEKIKGDYKPVLSFIGKNDIKKFIEIIEQMVPENDIEEKILMDTHTELCKKINWIPQILRHCKQ